jgi:parallel beta-helix repeat protein
MLQAVLHRRPQDSNPHILLRWLYGIAVLLAAGLTLAPARAAASPTYIIGPDKNGQATITVSGAGATVTLPQIRSGLGASARLLEDQGNGVWQLNANLLIDRGVALTLTSGDVRQLKLRSQASAKAPPAGQYDYGSFVYLRTDDGTITIDGVKVHSWDPKAQTFDTDVANGRSYILAKYAARLDIANAELSYLGSADGESYGVSWRDINDSANPDTLRTRVTGQVSNSQFHHNYYGVYTFQAAGMVFRGNRFYRNIGYGFDPHDFSHHFVVEDNQAFENGNHGFIISRGCNHFVFRRNVSYNNHNADPLKLAHGFMLDPGSPNSTEPQMPSFNNLLEANRAYSNEGYGLRILGSTNNTVRNNIFLDNLQGITVEQGSTGNILTGNTLTNNQIHGVFVRGGANTTTITGNTVMANSVNGIYIKSNGNTVSSNTVRDNRNAGIALLPETTTAAAVADLIPPGRRVTTAAVDPELVGVVLAESAIVGNQLRSNTVATNADDGMEIKGAINTTVEANVVERNGVHGIYLANGASNNRITRNTISFNQGNGIRANSADTIKNTWSENAVFGNTAGGILVTSDANSGIRPPVITTVQGNRVAGTTVPGAIVELYSDTGYQGRYFEGRTTAQADGRFTFTVLGGWKAPHINATTTDGDGNASAFTFIGRSVYLPLVVR